MTMNSNVKSIALLAGVVILVGGGAVAWSLNLSQGAKDRHAGLKSSIPDDKQLRTMLADSQYLVDVSRRELDHLEQSIPNLAYVPTLLRELEALGRRVDIEVTGVRPVAERQQRRAPDPKAAPEKKPPYEEINIEISGRGKFADLMRLVEELKAFPKIVAVQSITLAPRREAARAGDEPSSESPNLDATIRIKAFAFTPKAEGAPTGVQAATS